MSLYTQSFTEPGVKTRLPPQTRRTLSSYEQSVRDGYGFEPGG